MDEEGQKCLVLFTSSAPLVLGVAEGKNNSS